MRTKRYTHKPGISLSLSLSVCVYHSGTKLRRWWWTVFVIGFQTTKLLLHHVFFYFIHDGWQCDRSICDYMMFGHLNIDIKYRFCFVCQSFASIVDFFYGSSDWFWCYNLKSDLSFCLCLCMYVSIFVNQNSNINIDISEKTTTK